MEVDRKTTAYCSVCAETVEASSRASLSLSEVSTEHVRLCLHRPRVRHAEGTEVS